MYLDQYFSGLRLGSLNLLDDQFVRTAVIVEPYCGHFLWHIILLVDELK